MHFTLQTPVKFWMCKNPIYTKEICDLLHSLWQRAGSGRRCGGVIISCGCLLPFDIGPGRFQQFGHQRAEKKQATEEALLFKRVYT